MCPIEPGACGQQACAILKAFRYKWKSVAHYSCLVVINSRKSAIGLYWTYHPATPHALSGSATFLMSLYYNNPNYPEAYQAYHQRIRRFFADTPRNRFLELDMFAADD